MGLRRGEYFFIFDNSYQINLKLVEFLPQQKPTLYCLFACFRPFPNFLSPVNYYPMFIMFIGSKYKIFTPGFTKKNLIKSLGKSLFKPGYCFILLSIIIDFLSEQNNTYTAIKNATYCK